MNEIKKLKKTTPYGIQLEDESYMQTTEQVRNFLQKQCPCEIEIEAYEGKDISRVKVLSSQAPKQGYQKPACNPEYADKKNAAMKEMSELKNKTNARVCALECATNLCIAKSKEDASSNEILEISDEFYKFLEVGA